MKRTKKRMLVLTDGTYYFQSSSYINNKPISDFTNDLKKAWNFAYDGYYAYLNSKKKLQSELDAFTNGEPIVYTGKDKYGRLIENKDIKIDRSKFSLKWITIIETIKEEPFNYEGFAD